MRYQPIRRRLCLKQPPLRFRVAGPAPGVVGLDLGEAFAQVEWRELLRANGLRGKV